MTIVVSTSFSATIVSASIIYPTTIFEKELRDEHRDRHTSRFRPGPGASTRSTPRSASPSPTTASPPSAAASRDYEATLDRRRGSRGSRARVEVASIDIDEEMLKGHLALPRVLRRRALPAAEVPLDRARASARTARSRVARRARDPRRDPRGRGQRPLRPARRRPRRRRPRRPLAGDRGRPARASASTGRPSCRAAARSLEYEVDDRRRARARRGGRVAMRVLGIIRQPAPGLAQQRPAAGGRRAAARRGGAGRVRAPARRSRPTTPTSKLEGDAGGGARSCARRCARPTRS